MLLALAFTPVQAAPAEGMFVAADACPALQSIRNGTNPGSVMTAPGEAYPITESNHIANPTHYRVVIPGASPPHRWVAVTCRSKGEAEMGMEAGPDRYMVAASWQPGFCETQPDKVECLDQGESRFDADHFALHGLWPEPQGREYCEGVSSRDI
ncbi:MAG: ribonuclease, partial [Hyphomicrobiales bacterium]